MKGLPSGVLSQNQLDPAKCTAIAFATVVLDELVVVMAFVGGQDLEAGQGGCNPPCPSWGCNCLQQFWPCLSMQPWLVCTLPLAKIHHSDVLPRRTPKQYSLKACPSDDSFCLLKWVAHGRHMSDRPLSCHQYQFYSSYTADHEVL